MRIAVIHDSLNPCGGAERLALYLIKVLRELGCEVDLISLERTSWKTINKIFGEDFKKYIAGEIVVPPFRKIASIYGRYVEWFLRDVASFTFTSMLKDRYDVTIITKQLHVPIFVDIIYMHFPDFYPGIENLYYPERYTYNTFLRMYSLPSHIVSKLLISLFKRMKSKPLVLTNSKFSRALIRRWLGINAQILYPPVVLEKFEKIQNSKDDERRNIVVRIGRIKQGKNLHIIPFIASKVPDFTFVIIGSGIQGEYWRYLNKLIKDLRVQDRFVLSLMLAMMC